MWAGILQRHRTDRIHRDIQMGFITGMGSHSDGAGKAHGLPSASWRPRRPVCNSGESEGVSSGRNLED